MKYSPRLNPTVLRSLGRVSTAIIFLMVNTSQFSGPCIELDFCDHHQQSNSSS
jgi:hypothetical protein